MRWHNMEENIEEAVVKENVTEAKPSDIDDELVSKIEQMMKNLETRMVAEMKKNTDTVIDRILYLELDNASMKVRIQKLEANEIENVDTIANMQE